MLLATSVAVLLLVILAVAFRRWRARTALARVGPGQMVVYSTIARSRRW